ncbi:MAG: hypothetical protein GX558_06995 [Clostridiales bacterium]|nr:hypothetical protein [Clostridiales bacterium]
MGRQTAWPPIAWLSAGAAEFSEPVLEARVRDRLGIAHPISAAAARPIEALDLSSPSPEESEDNRIRGLSALARFSGLRELNPDRNAISDRGPQPDQGSVRPAVRPRF